ncbi:hypothetical protein H2248_005248 [Termitomyces sp. 'cryptogamus']|nr:hypothetical protein H2248_005248 [Termitomyces sp. 'cryptogamus']
MLCPIESITVSKLSGQEQLSSAVFFNRNLEQARVHGCHIVPTQRFHPQRREIEAPPQNREIGADPISRYRWPIKKRSACRKLFSSATIGSGGELERPSAAQINFSSVKRGRRSHSRWYVKEFNRKQNITTDLS